MSSLNYDDDEGHSRYSYTELNAEPGFERNVHVYHFDGNIRSNEHERGGKLSSNITETNL